LAVAALLLLLCACLYLRERKLRASMTVMAYGQWSVCDTGKYSGR